MLSEEEIKVLKDMAAFIDWSIKHDREYTWILLNIHHDCNGIIREESCFLPRTNGYAKTLAEGK